MDDFESKVNKFINTFKNKVEERTRSPVLINVGRVPSKKLDTLLMVSVSSQLGVQNFELYKDRLGGVYWSNASNFDDRTTREKIIN